jgi:pyruvate dehydrogenase E2 component (dihydrolipoamide acetyltransferase)
VVRASALALRDVPRANGAYRDGQFERYDRVNVGIVVAAQDALIVPTIYDADRKGLAEIARDSRRLTERVRSNEAASRELSGATFTVSNLGMHGVTRFIAVLTPPQAAILAVGAMIERPVVRDGELTPAYDGCDVDLRPPHPLRPRSRALPRGDPQPPRGPAGADGLTG